MRAAKHDEASEARGSKILGAFYEIMRARMLWAAGGAVIVGLMAGFIFYNRDNQLQFNNPSPAPRQTAANNSGQTTPPPVEPEEATPANMPAVPAANTDETNQVLGVQAATCQNGEQELAQATRDADLKAEDERYQNLMSKRSGIKQLLSAITGNIIAQPSQDEIDKHDAIVDQINQAYLKALSSAHCQ